MFKKCDYENFSYHFKTTFLPSSSLDLLLFPFPFPLLWPLVSFPPLASSGSSDLEVLSFPLYPPELPPNPTVTGGPRVPLLILAWLPLCKWFWEVLLVLFLVLSRRLLALRVFVCLLPPGVLSARKLHFFYFYCLIVFTSSDVNIEG